MKKLSSVILSFFILISMCSCNTSFKLGNVENAEIDYGVSEKYSKEDIDSAIQVVFDEFRTWFGFELYSINYAGDEHCDEDELEYCNSLREGAEFVDCIIFYSSFRTAPNANDEGFEDNEVYSGWSWHLAREADGTWQLLTWGY